MISLCAFFVLSVVLFYQSQHWPYGRMNIFDGPLKRTPLASLSIIIGIFMIALYSYDVGFIAAVLIVLFTASICLPLVVLMGRHSSIFVILAVFCIANIMGLV